MTFYIFIVWSGLSLGTGLAVCDSDHTDQLTGQPAQCVPVRF